MAEPTYTTLSFDDLKDWAADDHQAALDVFLASPAGAKWQGRAATAPTARAFFETHFQPTLIEDGRPMVFTGYYEPELIGSRVKTQDFSVPIYPIPADFDQNAPYLTRRQIDEGAARPALAWLADPVDLFFLQVQGSGRITMPDGSAMRVGFAAKNGHPYTSIGKVLIARGDLSLETVSPETIRAYVRQNGAAILWENHSYVFFREITDIPSDHGPIGAQGCAISALRSIAVDPAFTPLGTPVWIERTGMARLTVAQDTGSAIKGAQRADIFFGTGAVAGHQAGQVNDGGRMVALLPGVA